MKQNLATVTAINRDAVQTTRRQALADTEGISYLYFLSDALGPRLGKAFLTAYDRGRAGESGSVDQSLGGQHRRGEKALQQSAAVSGAGQHHSHRCLTMWW